MPPPRQTPPAQSSQFWQAAPSWADDHRAFAVDPSPPRRLVIGPGVVLARKYRLAHPAGYGGMAELWVATNEATGAEVCVKLLVPDARDDGGLVERFRREAYAAARLSHRAIVRVFDLLELGADGETTESGKPAALAIVMELLHGETLGELLRRYRKLTLDDALDIALPVLSALAHAHRAGVVHRDIKPENIFLARDPDEQILPKVLDFGVSKLSRLRERPNAYRRARSREQITATGVAVGTPSFMSPEQAAAASSVDARSDVFSAAVLLYVMLSGKNPFETESFHSVKGAILSHHPAPLGSVPPEVWAVLETALAKDPADRYADAGELAIALRRATNRPWAGTPESGARFVVAAPVAHAFESGFDG